MGRGRRGSANPSSRLDGLLWWLASRSNCRPPFRQLQHIFLDGPQQGDLPSSSRSSIDEGLDLRHLQLPSAGAGSRAPACPWRRATGWQGPAGSRIVPGLSLFSRRASVFAIEQVPSSSGRVGHKQVHLHLRRLPRASRPPRSGAAGAEMPNTRPVAAACPADPGCAPARG